MRRSKSQIYLESPAFAKKLYYRARKRENELEGRCVRCPNTVDDGHACCQDCRAKMAADKSAALEQGLCIDCWTTPALPGTRRCTTHAAIQQRRQGTTYTDRLVRRRCVRCGKAGAQDGLVTCRKCRAKDRNYRQAKRSVSQED